MQVFGRPAREKTCDCERSDEPSMVQVLHISNGDTLNNKLQSKEGRVQKLMDFGAFVNILPGRDGLVHISQISEERVQKVSDKLSEGQMVRVKVLEVDRQGRIRLSMKAVTAEEADAS